MQLSFEQNIAFQLFQCGANVFITGAGGTGKSMLIKSFKHHVYNNTNKTMHVTALTGCASLMLDCGAQTLHSWSGIGVHAVPFNKLIARLRWNKRILANWLTTDILVIDEVSMMSMYVFELLDNIGQELRRNRKPFGGIQVILSGDFYQLPPIRNDDIENSGRFCFESPRWNTVILPQNQIQLSTIFRQTDMTYVTILNHIRVGRIKQSHINVLEQRINRPIPADGIITPTRILPIRRKVDDINQTELHKLSGEPHTYTLKRKPIPFSVKNSMSEKEIEFAFNTLEKNMMGDMQIILKVGCQVMHLVNVKNDKDEIILCNGSQGRILEFIDGFPLVRFNNGIENIIRPYDWESNKVDGLFISQIPLILCWAITIHKSQGASLDMAEIDVGNDVFECGQTYVALSRVRNLDGVYLRSFDYSKIKVNKLVQEYYRNLGSGDASNKHAHALHAAVTRTKGGAVMEGGNNVEMYSEINDRNIDEPNTTQEPELKPSIQDPNIINVYF